MLANHVIRLRNSSRRLRITGIISTMSAYPPARRCDATDSFHGTTVPDPYRWLEDPDSTETVEWVGKQVAVTTGYFDQLSGTRQQIRARLEQLQSYERVGCPFTRGGDSFIFKNTGLQNQDVMYKLPAESVMREGARDIFASATPFLDLNAQFPDGTTSLGSSALSEDGKLYAYGLSRGGSDWQTLHVRDVATGNDLPDTVPWTKFTRIAWLHDGSGFFYSRHPAPVEVTGDKAGTETGATTLAMVMFHAIGTDASQDLLVHAVPSQPVWRFGAEVSDDGDYLLITTYKGTDPVNRLFYAHLPTVWESWKAQAQAARAGGEAPTYLQPGGAPPAREAYAYLPVVRAIDSWEADWDYVTNDGPRFYLKTNCSAPRYRVIAVDFAPTAPHAGGAHPSGNEEVSEPLPPLADTVPQAAKDVLDWATVVAGRYLLTCSLRDVANVLRVHILPGSPPALSSGSTALLAPSEVPLPGPGTIVSFSGRRDQDTAFVKYVSFLSPGTVLRLSFNPRANESDAALAPAIASGAEAAAAAAPLVPVGGFTGRVPHPCGDSFALTGASPVSAADVSTLYVTRVPGFNSDAFEARQVFVPSKDGTAQIPMFIVRKKTAGYDAGAAAPPAPTLLYGYGGFSVSLQPSYSALRLLWLSELGGVYALANLRGGGEYGEEWHAAGQRLKKQNVFDDLHACGEYLKGQGIAAKLGIQGGSNGGLLTLACGLQRPSLYDALVSQVPVTDMLRFHKFTVGALWRGEYGFVEDSKDDFECVMRYSPLHNVQAPRSPAEALPSTLITTADHDDRVSPLHSYKMAATLQEVAGASPHQSRPLLIRIETKAGHGAGKPTSKVLDEYADVWGFLAHELGATYTPAAAPEAAT